jgi:putative membrane protein
MKTKAGVRGAAFACLAALAVAGMSCDDDNDVTVCFDGGVAGTGAGGRGGAGGGGGTQDVVALDLTDAQVAAVVIDANASEVHGGEIGQARSTNAEVRAFATLMVTDHSMANTRVQALLLAQGVRAEDSATRRTLSDDAGAVLDDLWAAPATSFDVVYVDAQVAMHTAVLNLMDTVLIPSTENAAMKAELQAQRTAVTAHLAMAQQLRSTLGSDGGADGATDAAGDGG